MAESRYEDRTDSVEVKMGLLQDALQQGNFDLGMSLSESIKDTLSFARQRQCIDAATIDADTFAEVASLPEDWRRWARGWTYCKMVELEESVGLERRNEPVDIALAFREEQIVDLRREVRVARVEGGTLREIPSQVYDVKYADGQRRCRLVFFADVRADGRASHLIFYGNPNTELPAYATDLKVSGEGYGLDIENHHFTAHLSRQMGQLERLTYKHSHGLEVFAGGEGHGEPPNIDWAHDYLASGQFQKFRLTNWEDCPNWEVAKGPLCVKLRRWGFPHSPAHPLFTPSRMHIDVTYTFYAGQSYFLKNGRMEMIQDFELNYLRDDEWVFSGYSFSDPLWMDSEGRLHEGPVAAGHGDDLWGTGFFNGTSKDAFIALFLDHSAENFDALYHAGSPQIDYGGHGQLWSRWAARDNPQFKAGAVLKQYNAYLTSPYDGPGPVEETRRRLLAPLQKGIGQPPVDSGKESFGQLARPGETAETAPLKSSIWDALRQVRDGMFYNVDANVVDMGYVYDIQVRGDIVNVLMTMTHRGRPKYGFIGNSIRERLLQLEGVRDVVVDCTWEPPWSVERLNAAGRRAMGLES